MIYAMSDIHGCLEAFDAALALVDLSGDNKLLLLGDYIHYGENSYGVLDRIISLQEQYGTNKVIALMGNHERAAIDGSWRISERRNESNRKVSPDEEERDKKYIKWMKALPLYYTEGNTIFTHAGIDEEAEELWELGTDEYTFTDKYPAVTGKFYCGDRDMKIIAGHVGTAEISGDRGWHQIFYDGKSHYFIDGTVLDSGEIPIIAVDTQRNKYYSVTNSGLWPVERYDYL